MTKGRSFHLIPVLACLGILAGCGQGGHTPTSPEPLASVSAAQAAASAAASQSAAAPAAASQPQSGPTAVVDAASRDGLPRRHRDDGTPERRGANPHHGGGSAGGGAGEVQLSLAVQPDTWNVDFSHTPGTVAALISGTGLDAVDRGSIVLAGDAGTARPLSVQHVGDHLEARFANADALGTLASPIPGERQRVTLRLQANGAAQDLDAFVLITGQTVY